MDFFATIYETIFGLYNAQFELIFNELYENGGYILLGLSFFTLPLFMFIIFYLLWKYPYGKLWHWFFWLLITVVVTIGISWGIASNEIFSSDNQALNEALLDPDSGYIVYASTLPPKYALINGGMSLFLGFIYSLILKQFSKIQIHLPI